MTAGVSVSVAGGKDLIHAFLTLKSNFDSGVFMAVQRVAAKALTHPDAPKFHQERTALFKKRRDRIAATLANLGYKFQLPGRATTSGCEFPKATRLR